MFKYFVLLIVVLFPFRSLDQEFYIRRVYVISDFNSRFVLTYASRLLPPDRKLKQKDIQCFVDNLKSSQLFENVKTELVPLENNEEFYLRVTPEYKTNPNSIRIAEIHLDYSFDFDKEMFFRELKKKKIKPGVNFNPYTEIEMSIVGVIEELYLKAGKDELPPIWIYLRLIDSKGLRLTVSDSYPDCAS